MMAEAILSTEDKFTIFRLGLGIGVFLYSRLLDLAIFSFFENFVRSKLSQKSLEKLDKESVVNFNVVDIHEKQAVTRASRFASVSRILMMFSCAGIYWLGRRYYSFNSEEHIVESMCKLGPEYVSAGVDCYSKKIKANIWAHHTMNQMHLVAPNGEEARSFWNGNYFLTRRLPLGVKKLMYMEKERELGIERDLDAKPMDVLQQMQRQL